MPPKKKGKGGGGGGAGEDGLSGRERQIREWCENYHIACVDGNEQEVQNLASQHKKEAYWPRILDWPTSINSWGRKLYNACIDGNVIVVQALIKEHADKLYWPRIVNWRNPDYVRYPSPSLSVCVKNIASPLTFAGRRGASIGHCSRPSSTVG